MSDAQAVDLQTRLQHIDPYEFEHFVADLWARDGYDTEVSQQAADGGVDVIARTEDAFTETKKVIQAKRYSEGNKVDPDDVRAYAGVRNRITDADEVVLVTSSSFTSGARAEAAELNVKLVDGTDLAEHVRGADAGDLVADYAPPPGEIPTDTDTDEADEGTTATKTDTAIDLSAVTTNAYGYTVLALLGQAAGLALTVSPSLVPAVSTLATGMLFFLAWVVSPVVVVADLRHLRRDDDHTVKGYAYVLYPAVVFMVPVIGTLYYVISRPT
jgi:hypothetical protein